MAKIKVKEQPPKTKEFTNKKEFNKANKAYQDSLSLYNKGKIDENNFIQLLKDNNLDKDLIAKFTNKEYMDATKGIKPIAMNNLSTTGFQSLRQPDGSYKNKNFYRTYGNKPELQVDINDPLAKKLNTSFPTYKKPTTKPIYKKPVQPIVVKEEEPKTIEQKVEQLNKETKFADVVLEKPQAQSGEPFYHNNGDLIGFIQKGGKFEKLKDTQGLKPTTKEFLSDDKSVDNYMKFRLGEYYRGQAENK
jgi:hypothetical protein